MADKARTGSRNRASSSGTAPTAKKPGRARAAKAKSAPAVAPEPAQPVKTRKARSAAAPSPASPAPAPARPAKVARTGKSKPAPAPAAESPRPAKPAAAPPPSSAAWAAQAAADPLALMTPDQREALERLSRNLARAALTAQGAVAEAALRQADRPASLNPDPFHVGPALTEAMTRLAAQPDELLKAQAELFDGYMELWRQTSRRMHGEEAQPVAEPARGDKRFNDPEWRENAVFDVMKQSYLLTSNWLNGLVGRVEGMDPVQKRRVEFFTKLLTDAFSPSNFLLSNPAALREAMQSQGESLVRGAERFAADLERGGGQLAVSQTDLERFKVGENVATAPGKVVFRNALFELLQFSPSTPQVFEVPLLILPPWINKYYILDLRPDNSMIRWLTGQGFTVFVTSWVNPGPELAGHTLENYIDEGALTAVDQVLKQTGAKTANTVGYCIGGTLLACTLAKLAIDKDKRINSATFFAAQQDFAEAGDLLIFTNEEWIGELEKRMDAAGGVLPGRAMADTFNALRANDLVWSFFVSNYLMGKEPAAFDLLFWNADQTRMPKTLHLGYLRDFYKSNRLATGGLQIGGQTLDLKQVKAPVYVQAAKEDHIAPMKSVYRGARLFGGPVTFTLAGSGHIAGVINHPAAGKYQHWVNPALPETLEAWMAGAVEQHGSWWPHWAAWLAERSGKKVAARDPASGPLKPLGDAPGEYVRVRS